MVVGIAMIGGGDLLGQRAGRRKPAAHCAVTQTPTYAPYPLSCAYFCGDASGQPAVLACSALAPEYRDVLAGSSPAATIAANTNADADAGAEGITRRDNAAATNLSIHPGARRPGVAFVLLEPPAEELQQRLERREAAGAHFMPPSLLGSQLKLLLYDKSELWMHVAEEGEQDGEPGACGHQVGGKSCRCLQRGDWGKTSMPPHVGNLSSPPHPTGACRFPSPEQIVAAILKRLAAERAGLWDDSST